MNPINTNMPIPIEQIREQSNRGNDINQNEQANRNSNNNKNNNKTS